EQAAEPHADPASGSFAAAARCGRRRRERQPGHATRRPAPHRHELPQVSVNVRRASSLSAFLALTLLVSRPALAQSAGGSPSAAANAEAEVHFKRGVSLYQESDFRGAVVEFRRAYELGRNWRLLYNVGQAEYQSHEYAAALASFETFLREGGERIPRTRRAELEQELVRLRMRVGKLTIRASVPGSLVFIDDEPAGAVPVTRSVSVGGKRIVVKHDGYQPWVRNVEVASGDDLLFEATLEPFAGAAPVPSAASVAPLPPSPEYASAPPQATGHRFPWEPWAITGGLAVATVATGILALTASSKLASEKNRFDVTDDELASASSRVKTFAVLSDVFLVGTAVAAGASLYFTLKPTAPFSAGLRFTPSASGGTLSGRF
ncbi:MAG: uncharacterized protein JWP97_551, partial [Labilithrix sp.]|nr:uncharacterized protein [Labilithrix sp.]